MSYPHPTWWHSLTNRSRSNLILVLTLPLKAENWQSHSDPPTLGLCVCKGLVVLACEKASISDQTAAIEASSILFSSSRLPIHFLYFFFVLLWSFFIGTCFLVSLQLKGSWLVLVLNNLHILEKYCTQLWKNIFVGAVCVWGWSALCSHSFPTGDGRVYSVCVLFQVLWGCQTVAFLHGRKQNLSHGC